MRTSYNFSNPLLKSVYYLLKRKVGGKIEEIPFEDIAQEIEIVYFQNPNEDLFTLVTLCRRAMRSLLYQYGYSPDYGKDKVNFDSCGMSEEELNCYSILDEKIKYMSCSDILRSYGIVPKSSYVHTLSKMLMLQVTDKKREEQRKNAAEKYRFSEKMLHADYCTVARILKKIVKNPEANPFKAIEKLPKERAERISRFLQTKHHLQIA
ncbi:MAG: hypothetical protein ACOYN4_14570 [Bacteroidales bacterium]